LDVLGFAELLYRDGYSQQLKLYMDTINEVIRPTHVKVECVVFSDSIVLTASGDTERAFRGLIKACSAAFHELVMCDMPVRGAVAFGATGGKRPQVASSLLVALSSRHIVSSEHRSGLVLSFAHPSCTSRTTS